RSSQTRLPQPMNLERDRASQMGVTPMRGHRGTRPPSVERPMGLHLDKNWVAERAQQVLEHLEHSQKQFLGGDFFTRPGGLRKISFKQFVTILNHFFQNIWRNRTVVGANPVEDVTAALQKLHYPHTVSKSWITTPNTQHSFGHVVVLLDFLMDFVPSAEDLDHEQFPFMETAEQPSAYLLEMTGMCTTTLSSPANSTHHAPLQLGEELNAMLFQKSAVCNPLWNEERAEEEEQLQATVSDLVVDHRSSFPSRKAVEQDCGGLTAQLAQLDEQLRLLGEEKTLQQLEKLTTEQEQLQLQLRTCQEELRRQQTETDVLLAEQQKGQETLQAKICLEERLRNDIACQKYTVRQLRELQMRHESLKNESQVYGRQVEEIEQHESNQQVMLSRAKKKLLDTIESFNSYVRQIGYSAAGRMLPLQSADLSLSLQPQSSKDIRQRAGQLQELSGCLERQRQENEKQLQQLERGLKELQQKCNSSQQELANLAQRLRVSKHGLQRINAPYATRIQMKRQHQEQLTEDHMRLTDHLESLHQTEHQLATQLEAKAQRNQRLLAEAQQVQDQLVGERHAYLDEYEKQLAKAQQELGAFTASAGLVDAMLAQKRRLVERSADLEPVAPLSRPRNC
ncbi:hypothetical protein KR018_005177, partial [Drosophila ironensis]